MSVKKLEAALTAVDWNSNVAIFVKNVQLAEKVAASNLRIAVWARQFELVDAGNPALCFVREMQSSSQQVAALTALALYKSAAAAMRTVVETALYYTFFRTHASELQTLVRDKDYFIDKKTIIDYHRTHTPNFKIYQEKLGLSSRLEEWYSYTSAIIHGQLPGVWTPQPAIGQIAHVSETQTLVINRFCDGEDIVHRLFLTVLSPVMWDDFSTTAKKHLISGLSGDVKTLLKLDTG